jgi:hypothetical protein
MKPAKMQRKPTTKDLDGQGPSRKSKNPRIQDRPRPAHNLSLSHGPVINIVHDDEPDQHARQRSSVLSLSEGTRNTASRSQVFSREYLVNTLQPHQTSSTSRIQDRVQADRINWNCLRIKITRVAWTVINPVCWHQIPSHSPVDQIKI